jgi:(2Fe-2S) ferredoxin
MGKCQAIQASEFALEGLFLGYDTSGSKLKYIRLANTSEYKVKLSKDLRSQLLIPGEWLHLAGTRKTNPITGEVKLKAETLTRAIPPCFADTARVAANPKPANPKPTKPETILVCQKSDCCKLGAKAIATALNNAIQEQGLSNQVTVKGTGCMKRCKAGPNIVMPDRTRYTKISPKAIPALIEQHFTPTPIPAAHHSPPTQPTTVSPIVATPVAS